MQLVIHRGTHEIGGSCVEITGGQGRLIIDIGVPLVDSSGQKFNIRDYKGYSGPELVEKGILPNISGLYKWDTNNDRPNGILISHAHIDHYGFYKHIHEDIPFYLGEASHKIMDISAIFNITEGSIVQHKYIKSGQPLAIGDFIVTPFLMDHSAFDAYAFLVEGDGKRLMYSGDFRSHGRKEKAYRWWLYNAPKEVDALLLEGTTLGRAPEKCKSEKDVENEIYEVIKEANNITFISSSGQNIDRLVSIFRACRRTDKIFLVDCYVAVVLKALNAFAGIPYPSKDFPEIRVFYLSSLFDKAEKSGHPELMYQFKKFKMMPDEISAKRDKVVMLVRSTMVPYLKTIAGIQGGDFIYTMWQGYWNENSMKPIRDFIEDEKLNYHYIHTSGHADFETLKETVDHLRPKLIVPIHTFHPESYESLGVPIHVLNDGEGFQL